MNENERREKKSLAAGKLIGGLLLLAALILAFTGYKMYRKGHKQESEEKEQEEFYDRIRGENGRDKLAEATAINPQTVAWLTIPETPIDYPVLQSEDNEYYLNHDLNREESQLGVPFLDYRCDSDFSGFHSIIYGHHITKERMFTPLVHFTEEEYFDSHTYGELITEEETYKIHFLACMVLKSNSFVYETVFLSEEEKAEFLNKVKDQAVQIRDFNVEELIEGQMVTLSTCSYEFEDARTVLIGYLESQTG